MLQASIIIPTYHREKEIRDCVQCLLKQTVLPYEIIIIDDGHLPEPPLQRECLALGIGYIYKKKEVPGLTESRNLGISLATGDILFFLDDDVLFDEDYVAEMLSPFENDNKNEVAGVGGLIHEKPLSFLVKCRKIIEIFFGASWFYEGKVLPSGFCSNFGKTPFPIKTLRSVQFLSGGVAAYRRKIFDEFRFTPGYRNLAAGEDKDFSFRVSQKHKLLINPKAKLHHLEAASMRPDHYKMGRMFVCGRYMFFRWYCYKNPFSWFFFYYAMLGYSMIRVAYFLVHPGKNEFRRLQGIFGAIRDILLKRIAASSQGGHD